MSDVLISQAGKVAALDVQDALPAIVTVEQFTVSDVLLIQSIAYEQKTNQQFQTSLEKAVYIYVFGDQMGSVTVSGLAFVSGCSGETSGLAGLVEYYKSKRASKRSTPVIFSVGDEVQASGFLTALQVRSHSENPELSGLVYGYSMTINTLPEG